MNYIEFEEAGASTTLYMRAPHSHEFYELYFLLKGKRDVFLDNKMFVIEEKTLVVIPPFSMHKTEGGAYNRININISPSLLSETQTEFLKKLSEKTAIRFSKEYENLIIRLLKEGAEIQKKSFEFKNDNLLSLANTILLFISLQDTASLAAASTAYKPNLVSSEVLKIIYFINQHYTENITLKTLCDEFYLSKVSLCKKFKEVMHCSINKYISDRRLNKAKSLLKDTNMAIEEIADVCGYSSANYFGLIFKKEVGLSPLNYRKSR